MERDLDKKLYNDYLNGEKEAFEFLYNKYKDKIQYFIFNIIKDYQRAEDLTQETFIYVMQNEMKKDCSFKYYIYLIAKSKAFNYKNVKNRRDEISETYLTNGDWQNEKDVLDMITKEETKREVLESIELLEEKYRNAIYLVNIEGFSYEKTSYLLGETLQNTKNLIHRGKKQLRRILLKKGFDKMNKVSKMITIVLCVVVVLSGITYAAKVWNIEFKKYEKNVESPNDAITSAKELGYADEFDGDYIVKDGVGIKIDSFLVTDDCLNVTVHFKFSEKKEVNSDSFEFGYVIYDEDKNVYQVAPRMYLENLESEHDAIVPILKELGVEYDENNIFSHVLSDSASIEPIETTENRTIIKDITIRAKESFPKSKKIYIRFFDLGYSMMDTTGMVGQVDWDEIEKEDFDITDEEWIIEMDVSDKMYERETLELELKNEIPGIEIQKCTLTESGMVLIFKSEEYIDFVCIGKEMKDNFSEKAINIFNIIDKDGKFYQTLGNGPTEDGAYKVTIDVAKKDFEKGLFVDFESNGIEYTSELIEK